MFTPPGRSLSEYVDDALISDTANADWTLPAEHLRQGRVDMVESRDPISRVFTTAFGQRSLSLIKNEGRTAQEIGFLAADVVGSLLRETQRIPSVRNARLLIVAHGDGLSRRSLLVLDPSLDKDELPRVLPSRDIAEALRAFRPPRPPTRLPVQNPEDLLQAAWIARPRVVVAPAPPMEPVCVQRPAGNVVRGPEKSTVGAYVQDAWGQTGVTVCFHGAGPPGTQVDIDGVVRTVATASQALDICFIPIPRAELPTGFNVAKRGVLKSRGPGPEEKHTFWASNTGDEKLAKAKGCDHGVPYPSPGRQLCVQTDAVSNYGDSGGALVNDYDELVGFAFQRTAFGHPLQFSDWTWAHSALSELGLVPL